MRCNKPTIVLSRGAKMRSKGDQQVGEREPDLQRRSGV